MLDGLTAGELAALAVHFCGEMAGHQIMDAPAPVEPTQLDRIERKLDELLLLARVEFDGNEWDGDVDDPIEAVGSLDDEGEGHGGEACKNCGKLYGDCTCIGGFIDEYEVNENGWKN